MITLFVDFFLLYFILSMSVINRCGPSICTFRKQVITRDLLLSWKICQSRNDSACRPSLHYVSHIQPFAHLLHVSQILLPLKLPLIRPSVLHSESFDLLSRLVIFLDLPHVLFIDREHLEIDEVLLHIRKTIAGRREQQGSFVDYPRIPDGDRAIRCVEGYIVAVLRLRAVLALCSCEMNDSIL